MRDACPCTSGRTYAACCAVFHRGEREPATPAELVRARFAAFAQGRADYLLRTLHAEHEDRARPDAEVLAELRDGARRFRYMGLTLVESADEDAAGVARVLFVARVFERGVDRTFAELSGFARERGAWRYLYSEAATGPAADGRPIDLATLSIATLSPPG